MYSVRWAKSALPSTVSFWREREEMCKLILVSHIIPYRDNIAVASRLQD